MAEKKLTLIVDDDPDVITVTSDLLEALGFRPLAANDFDAALDLWSDRRDEVRTALIDYTLGERTGDELAEFFLSERPDLQVIIMTGATPSLLPLSEELRHRALFLPKPFTVAAFRKTLKELAAREK